MNLNNKIFLSIILILAFTLRSFQIDKFPAGFNADEAAIGYNAYSILKTAKDEYGEFLPLSFKSFGDYKPGLYFYFVIPSVAIFGLNEFAVRLPSVIFGTGLVLVIYLLAQQFFSNRKISFFAAFFLAINPWAINFSRGGWETNSATFFIALGVLLLIKGFNRINYLVASLVVFLTSMYLYQAPRLIVPVLLFFVGAMYWKVLFKEIKKSLKQSFIGLGILIILSLPLFFQFIGGNFDARFSGLSFLSDPGPTNRVNELRGEHSNLKGFIAKSLHNKVTAYVPNFLGHYLDHFTGDFLFINGDPLIRNNVPEVGEFYLVEALFLVAGILFLLKLKSKQKYLLLAWVLTAPIASAMTYQTPHAVRALSMVVPITLIMSFGFINLLKLINKRWLKILAGFLVMIFLSFEFIHYLESYYVHYPKRYPLSWEYGFREMVKKLNFYEKNFNKVVITDRYDQPYILVLFYQQYDPAQYQPQAILSERDKFNFGTVSNFDKYEFHKITPSEVDQSENTLFIATPQEIKDKRNILDTIYFPNGEEAFVFLKK